MARRNQVLLLLAAVAGVLSVLVWGTGGFATVWRLGGGKARTAAARPAGSTAVGAAPQPAGRGTPTRSPALFGRSEEPRAGTGALVGRVVDFATGWPVAEAIVGVTGAGFGGESVDAAATTDDDGRFAFPALPAGSGYALRVEAKGLPVRAVSGIDVPDGSTTDLGTLWLGRRAALAGVVVDPEGRGIADATVDLHRGAGALARVREDFGELLGRLDREESPAVRLATDASGAFASQPLDPGPWTLHARARGFAQRSVSVAMTSSGVVGGDLRIGLRPGASVAGRVVDGAGVGIEGARVAVMAGDDPDSFLYGRVFTETGSGGRFRVEALPDGEDLTAVVAAPGHPTTFASLAPGEDGAVIVLHRSVPLTVRLLEGGTEQPVADAHVVVAVGDQPEVEDQPGTLVSGRTDAAGRVRLEARAGALQMAYVTHRDHSPALWTADAADDLPGLLRGPEDPTIPEAGGEIVLRLPASIAITGRVTDGEGKALAGAEVKAVGPTGLPRSAVTDGEGRYRVLAPSFGGIQAAAFVIVRAPGFVQPPATRRVPPASQAEGVFVHDVALEPAVRVSGRVVDGQGQPLAGALVEVEPAQGSAPPPGGPPLPDVLAPARSWSAEDGSYALDAAATRGPSRVRARLRGFLDGATPPFTVAAGRKNQAPDLVLRVGASLEVRVLGPAGSPLAGAVVRGRASPETRFATDAFAAARPDAEATTDARGHATLRFLAPGTLRVEVQAPGHAGAVHSLEVPASDVALPPLTVSLAVGARLEGCVLDPRGAPLVGALVRVLDAPAPEGALPPSPASTGADGRFRIDGVPEGSFTLLASRPGYAARRIASARTGQPLEVRLAVEDPARAARRREIQALIAEAGRDLATARGAARTALEQRGRSLLEELQALDAASDGGGDDGR